LMLWLTRVEAKTLNDTSADVKAEAQLHALAETVPEVEAKKLNEKLSDMKANTLLELVHDTLAKDGGRNNW